MIQTEAIGMIRTQLRWSAQRGLVDSRFSGLQLFMEPLPNSPMVMCQGGQAGRDAVILILILAQQSLARKDECPEWDKHQ